MSGKTKRFDSSQMEMGGPGKGAFTRYDHQKKLSSKPSSTKPSSSMPSSHGRRVRIDTNEAYQQEQQHEGDSIQTETCMSDDEDEEENIGSTSHVTRKETRALGEIRKSRLNKGSLVFEVDESFGRIIGKNSQVFITKGGCVMRKYAKLDGTTWKKQPDLLKTDIISKTTLIVPDRAVNEIFGFGPQGLSVISQLASQGAAPDAFSHCLVGNGDAGGILVLDQIMDPNMVYLPLIPSDVSEGDDFAWCIGFQKIKGQGIIILGGTKPVTKSSSRKRMSNASSMDYKSSLHNTLYKLTPIMILAPMLHSLQQNSSLFTLI
ncbi:Myb domain protein 62 [Tanacetum coccineum]